MSVESNSASAEENNVSDEEISEVALEIIKNKNAPMLLSTLGNIISARYKKSLRELLGRRRLRYIIEKNLSGKVGFLGDNTRLEVYAFEEGKGGQYIKYDPIFWTAFSKPIRAESTRWISATYPFEFVDIAPGSKPASGYMQIEASLIPPSELPKEEREPAIKNSIRSWCMKHSLPQEGFSAAKRPRPPKGGVNQVAGGGGWWGSGASNSGEILSSSPTEAKIRALVSFIDAVPEGDRSKYTLPLDLIRHFVS